MGFHFSRCREIAVLGCQGTWRARAEKDSWWKCFRVSLCEMHHIVTQFDVVSLPHWNWSTRCLLRSQESSKAKTDVDMVPFLFQDLSQTENYSREVHSMTTCNSCCTNWAALVQCLDFPVEIVPMARLYNNAWKSMNVHWESLRHPFARQAFWISTLNMTLYCQYESVSIEIHDVSTEAKHFQTFGGWSIVWVGDIPVWITKPVNCFTPQEDCFRKGLLGFFDHYNQWATACCPYFSADWRAKAFGDTAEQVVCLAHPRVVEVG